MTVTEGGGSVVYRLVLALLLSPWLMVFCMMVSTEMYRLAGDLTFGRPVMWALWRGVVDLLSAALLVAELMLLWRVLAWVMMVMGDRRE